MVREQDFIVWKFFPFSILYHATSCWPVKVSAEKPAGSLIPLDATSCFSLTAFKIFSLTFTVVVIMCPGVDLLGSCLLKLSELPGPVCSFHSPDKGKFSAIISSE